MQIQYPTIQNYSNYRDYLHDWFKAGKTHNDKLSYRFLSRRLELKSPNHIHLVMTKKRHLSTKTLIKMLQLLGINKKEKAYLKALFEYETAKSSAAAEKISLRINELKSELTQIELPRSDFQILTNSVAWFMMMGAHKFDGLNLEEICSTVKASCTFDVSGSDVEAALDTLIKLGKVELKNGRHAFDFDFDFESIRTAWDFDSNEIKQFHHNNLALAVTTIPWDIEKRFFSNVSFPANTKIIEYAKSEIRSLCRRLSEATENSNLNPNDYDKVVSIQFALFPFFDFDTK